MIVGYGVIAVPTGIVTAELTRAAGRGGSVTPPPTLVGAPAPCVRCGEADNPPDARFCKRCGARLGDGS